MENKAYRFDSIQKVGSFLYENMVNFLILYLVSLFFHDKIHEIVRIFLLGAVYMIILFLKELFRKPLQEMGEMILSYLIKFPFMHRFILFHISIKTQYKYYSLLETKQFHLIFQKNNQYRKIILALMYYNPTYQKYLSPKAIHQLERWINEKNLTDYHGLEKLYSQPLKIIIEKILHNLPLEELEIERIAYEMTQEQRQMLESKLDALHPLLIKINKLNSIKINAEFSILK